MAAPHTQSADQRLQTYLKMIRGLVGLTRAVCYLDGECVKKDEDTYIINGVEVRIPREMVATMGHCIDIAIEETMEAAARVGMSMVPLGLLVMRAWVCYGHAFSPCVIMHHMIEELRRRGYSLREMKALGDIFVEVRPPRQSSADRTSARSIDEE